MLGHLLPGALWLSRTFKVEGSNHAKVTFEITPARDRWIRVQEGIASAQFVLGKKA